MAFAGRLPAEAGSQVVTVSDEEALAAQRELAASILVRAIHSFA
ncbi:MAG: hypothetical protein WCI75_15535 [candidate division NC10 bacterium]